MLADREPPDSLDAPGRQMWERMTAHAWWLAAVDVFMLELACSMWDDCCSYRDQIVTDGLLIAEPVFSARGVELGAKQVVHPLLHELRSVEKALLAITERMGFSPAARAKLGVGEVAQEDQLSDLIARRNLRLEQL